MRKVNPPEAMARLNPVERASKKTLTVTQFSTARRILAHDGFQQAGFMAGLAHRFSRRSRLPVLFQHGEAHRKQRAAIAQFFTPTTINNRYRKLIIEQSERLVAEIREKPRQLDLLALELAVIITAELVGLTQSSRTGLTKRLSRFFEMKQGTGRFPHLGMIVGTLEAAVAMVSFYFRDLRPAIRVRKAERRSDVISHLLDQNYTAREILTESITYGAAGIATTRELIMIVAWHMFENTELRARFLKEDGAGRTAIIEEILRLEPVVGTLYRFTDKTITLEDEKDPIIVPGGTLIAIDVRAVNADETVAGKCPFHISFSRPKQKNLTGSIISFGDGQHRCPGANLALEETVIFIEKLLGLPGVKIDRAPNIAWNPVVQSYELRKATVSCAAEV